MSRDSSVIVRRVPADISVGRSRDCGKHPVMHGTDLAMMNYLVQI